MYGLYAVCIRCSLYSYFVECGNSKWGSVNDVCNVVSLFVRLFNFVVLRDRTGCSLRHCLVAFH